MGANLAFDPKTSPPGSPEEEAIAGEVSYLDVLASIHSLLRPKLYLEIGVRHGRSLALACGAAIGVDPAPYVTVELPSTKRIVAATSDEFFAGATEALLGGAPDLVFIDGMHLFEFALRDFMNVERLAAPGALVVIDDVFPCHPAQAERTRRTRAWTGDVWRLHSLLKERRPDLFLLSVDAGPTGLLLIAGLDASNRTLQDEYVALVAAATQSSSEMPSGVLTREGAVAPDDGRVAKILVALKEAREASAHPREIVARLRELAGKDSVSPS
jgi:predicted O-methyltransferase YrrM